MLGKANEICRFQPSKLKGLGTSTSFCTGASASSLTRSPPLPPLLSSQQVQWDGVDARLRHQEGVPRTHGTRQHEPEIRGFQPTSCHSQAGSPTRPSQLGLCPRKLAASRKATSRFGIAPAETRGEAAHGTAGSPRKLFNTCPRHRCHQYLGCSLVFDNVKTFFCSSCFVFALYIGVVLCIVFAMLLLNVYESVVGGWCMWCEKGTEKNISCTVLVMCLSMIWGFFGAWFSKEPHDTS